MDDLASELAHHPELEAHIQSFKDWLLVSEPGLLKVLGDLGRKFKFILKLRPGSNIV